MKIAEMNRWEQPFSCSAPEPLQSNRVHYEKAQHIDFYTSEMLPLKTRGNKAALRAPADTYK